LGQGDDWGCLQECDTWGVAPVKPLGQLEAVLRTIKDCLGATLGVAPLKHLGQLEAVPQQHGVLLPQSL